MVSLTPTFDVEFFNSAYEHIYLIANKTWAFDEDDPYRKLNEHLWVQNFKYFEKLHGKCVSRRKNSYNVISGSSTPQYYNQQCNTERESLSSQNDYLTSAQHNATNSYLNKSTTEPWMLDEVEECFTQLTSNTQSIEKSHCSLLNDDSSEFVHAEKDHDEYYSLPYKVNNVAELQLQIRISHENIRHIWNTNEVNQPTSLSSSSSSSSLSSSSSSMSSSVSSKNEKYEYNCSRLQQHDSKTSEKLKVSIRGKDIDRPQHQRVTVTRTHYKTCNSDNQKESTSALLSAEVPEFFPKNSEINGASSYHVPSQNPSILIDEKYYRKRVEVNMPPLLNVHSVYQNPSIPVIATPIMAPMMRSSYHHWIPYIPPPPPVPIPISALTPHSSISLQSLCPVIHRPIQLHEKLIIHPGHINNAAVPIPVYQRPPELYHDHKQRHRSQGVDFNNLILLTKSAMKARRNQSKNPQQNPSVILESRQPNLKSETDVLQWLNTGYPKKAREFPTINSLICDLNSYEYSSKNDRNENSQNPDLFQLIFNQRGNYCAKNNASGPDNNDFSINTFR